VTVRDLSKRKDGTFSRSDFSYDKYKDIYTCPAGRSLKTTGRLHADDTYRYLASTRDCGICPLKPNCCPNVSSRRIPRDVNETARDIARSLVDTPEFQRSRDDRKKVEMRFAHLKTHHRFERMRLRGLSGARDEFHLAANASGEIKSEINRKTSFRIGYTKNEPRLYQGAPGDLEAGALCSISKYSLHLIRDTLDTHYMNAAKQWLF